MNEKKLHQEIFRVAHDIYERSGRIEGRDLDNWLEAERIVRTLRKIAGEDNKRHIFVNVPMARSEEEGEYSKWMIKFFER
jgi:replicative DNA helicase